MEYTEEFGEVVEDSGDGGWVDTHHHSGMSKIEDEIKEMTLVKDVSC